MEFLSQSAFSGAIDGLVYGGNEWVNINKITKPVITYPFSPLRPITKLAIYNMDCNLGGISMVKATYESNTDTGATHDIYPNYGYFLTYHQDPSGYYITFGNRGNEPITGYVTIMVRLGGGVI